MNTQQLTQEIEALPVELQRQVADFVVFLRRQQRVLAKRRTVGEYAGKIHIHPDFDAPLPEEFWLGEAEK